MAETPKVVNYFLVAGLPEKSIEKEPITRWTIPKLPITDIVIINKTQGEAPPPGFECLDLTPTNFPANLNHGSIMAPEMYICFKRGRDSPPVVDIGVFYQSSKYKLKSGVEIITTTPYGRSANVNNTMGEKIYITFSKAVEMVDWDTLAVSDVCIILPGKGETVPHAFHQIDKSLNLGMIGSDVYLCYRKSFIKNKCLTYDAELLFRYPTTDDTNLPMPQKLPMFCLPQGAAIERWGATSRHPLPVYSTFVLTDQTGQKCYGAAVVFYKDFNSKYFTQKQREFFDDDGGDDGSVGNDGGEFIDSDNDVGGMGIASNNHVSLNKPSDKNNINVSKKIENDATEAEDILNNNFIFQQNQSICLLSRWPFFESFKKFLLYLYRISVSGPQGIPIERYISHFIDEIPFPIPERPYVSIQLSTEMIMIMLLDESPLTKSSGASYSKFLLNLGPENCIHILLYVLLEHKIVIHSLRPDLLTCVVETASTMIFPFQWQCPYVPLCPLQLSEVIDSPTPFIIGLDSSFFDNTQPPNDVTYVDLDAQSITISQERTSDTIKLLPKKALRTLRTSLEELYDSLVDDPSCPGTPGELECHGGFNIRDALNQQNQRKMDAQIQECFLRFMADMMKGYSSFLRPVSNYNPGDVINISSLFNVQGFLKSHDRSYHKLLSQILRTQYFCRFLEERSLGSVQNSSLAFFDACLDKLMTNPDARLIEVEEKCPSERTVVISFLDNVKEIPNVSYSYNSFADLNLELFSTTLHNIKGDKISRAIKNDSTSPTSSQLTTTSITTSTSTTTSQIVVTRTFNEIKLGNNVVVELLKDKNVEELFARCLLWVTYSIWFTLLPSFIEKTPAKKLLLCMSHSRMIDLLKRGGRPLDELPYKIFFQLCGIHNEPNYATDVYNQMVKCNFKFDVATYGFYNSAILQQEKVKSNKAWSLWMKLSIVIQSITRFKHIKNTSKKTKSVPSIKSSNRSLDKVESTNALNDIFSIFNRSPIRSSIRSFNRSPVPAAYRTTLGFFNSTFKNNATLEASSKKNSDLNNVGGNGARDGVDGSKVGKDEVSKDTTLIRDGRRISDLNQPAKQNTTNNKMYQSWAELKSNVDNISDIKNNKMAVSATSTPSKTNELRDQLTRVNSFPEKNDGSVAKATVPNSDSLSNIYQITKQQVSTVYQAIQSKFNTSPSKNQNEETIPKNVDVVLRNDLNDCVNEAIRSCVTSSTLDSDTSFISSSSLSSLTNLQHVANSKQPTINNNNNNVNNNNNSLLASDNIDAATTSSSSYNSLSTSHLNIFYCMPNNDYTAKLPQVFVDMTSQMKCNNCKNLLHDEQIVSGWKLNDSNLETLCCCCAAVFMPKLHISMHEANVVPAHVTNIPSSSSSPTSEITLDEFEVPYLNPLVLRKELDNLIKIKGEGALSCYDEDGGGVRKYSIVYWNIIWHMSKLGLPTHLKKKLHQIKKTTSIEHITCRPLWDSMHNIKTFGVPMYSQWSFDGGILQENFPGVYFNKSTLQNIISGVVSSKIPVDLIISERSRSNNPKSETLFRGMFYDIMFLALYVLGSKEFNLNKFELDYTSAYKNLPQREQRKVIVADEPCKSRVTWCRKVFNRLLLVNRWHGDSYLDPVAKERVIGETINVDDDDDDDGVCRNKNNYVGEKSCKEKDGGGDDGGHDDDDDDDDEYSYGYEEERIK